MPKRNWVDGATGNTPLNAARLNALETDVDDGYTDLVRDPSQLFTRRDHQERVRRANVGNRDMARWCGRRLCRDRIRHIPRRYRLVHRDPRCQSHADLHPVGSDP